MNIRNIMTAILCAAALATTACRGSGSSSESSVNEQLVSAPRSSQSLEQSASAPGNASGSAPENSSAPSANNSIEASEKEDEPVDESIMYITVNGTTFTARLADNISAKALAELLKSGDVTVNAHDYGGFEKVGELPQSLPRCDEQITTSAGDLILYQGSSFVFYYAANSWNFTRLGRVEGVTTEQLLDVFGSGNADLILSLKRPG